MMRNIASLSDFFSNALAVANRGKYVEQQARKEKNIIYGAQAVNKQIGLYGRESFDYDVLARRPRQSADRLQKTLDKASNGDNFFSEPSKFTPGVWKVYNKGFDKRKNTSDDVHIADYNKYKRIPYTVINGVRYAKLSSTIRDKKKSLADPAYAFRHEKDREDLNNITTFQKLRRIV